jgi:hypothetical protein
MRRFSAPAFPRPYSFTSNREGAGQPVPGEMGMSYREWLIGMALAGMCFGDSGPDYVAKRAIEVADAVISQLEGEKP